MGQFIDGVHFCYQTKLGPNERFGIADDMEFYEFAINLKKAKKETKQNKIDLKTSKYTFT